MRHLLPLPLVAAVAALAVPGAAVAAPGHWSSPVEIAAPGGGADGAAPQVFVAGGRTLALASDGRKPLLAVGDASGRFAAPIALSGDQPTINSLDGAVAPDGTLVVAWASGGTPHVVTVPPGGAPSSPADLGGSGVNSVAVAVAPDNGTITVAYRVKEGQSSYGLLAASAPRGGGFGAPASLDATSAAIDSVDVAAGAGGAVAVVYRKGAPRFKTFVVSRSAAAPNYEAPVALGGSPTQADLEPQVAFDADGTIVAAWANPDGPGYATRGPLENAWAPSTPLDAAGNDHALAMDLVPTPPGGTAAAWSGDNVVRAAVRPLGGAFGAPVQLDAYTGPVVSEPAVTVAPDATLTVVAGHPDDGAVQASDAGGASTLIGYGAIGTVIPVALASSTDRTVAVWRNAGGGYSAATRSDSAPPSTGPGTKPAAPDRTAPKVTFAGKTKRILVRKAPPKAVAFPVRCDEPCKVSATGNLRITQGKKKIVSPLRSFSGTAAKAGVQTVSLKLGPLAQKDLKKALRRGRGANVFADVTATDATGNATRLRLQLTIKPR